MKLVSFPNRRLRQIKYLLDYQEYDYEEQFPEQNQIGKEKFPIFYTEQGQANGYQKIIELLAKRDPDLIGYEEKSSEKAFKRIQKQQEFFNNPIILKTELIFEQIHSDGSDDQALSNFEEGKKLVVDFLCYLCELLEHEYFIKFENTVLLPELDLLLNMDLLLPWLTIFKASSFEPRLLQYFHSISEIKGFEKELGVIKKLVLHNTDNSSEEQDPELIFTLSQFKARFVQVEDKEKLIKGSLEKLSKIGLRFYHLKYINYTEEDPKVLFKRKSFNSNFLLQLKDNGPIYELFGNLGVYGDEPELSSEGVWLVNVKKFGGSEDGAVPEDLKKNNKLDYFEWNELSVDNEEDKKKILDFWTQKEGEASEFLKKKVQKYDLII